MTLNFGIRAVQMSVYKRVKFEGHTSKDGEKKGGTLNWDLASNPNPSKWFLDNDPASENLALK